MLVTPVHVDSRSFVWEMMFSAAMREEGLCWRDVEADNARKRVEQRDEFYKGRSRRRQAAAEAGDAHSGRRARRLTEEIAEERGGTSCSHPV